MPLNNDRKRGSSGPSGGPSLYALTWFMALGLLLFFSFCGSILLGIAADSVTLDGRIDISPRNFFLAAAALQILFLFVPTVMLARRHPLGLVEVLRLRMPAPRWWLLVTIAIVTALVVSGFWGLFQEVYLVPADLTDWYLAQKGEQEALLERMMVGGSIPLLLLGIFSIGAMTGLAEESFFRGLVQRGFEEERPAALAIALTAILFAAVHFQAINLIPLIGLGLLLGFITWRSGSILPAIYGHALFNSLQLGIVNAKDMPYGLDDPSFTATPAILLESLPIVLISAGILLVTIALMRRS